MGLTDKDRSPVNSLLEIFASVKNFQVELSTIDTVAQLKSAGQE
jgi:hypothetical protein